MHRKYLKQAGFAFAAMSMVVMATGCSTKKSDSNPSITTTVTQELTQESSVKEEFTGTVISLEDGKVLVDGETASTDASQAVYTGADIIYYEEGKDDTYGEGTESDAHSATEAASHTVITITKPGSYQLTGSLPAGQVVIDLGEDAKEDPTAVVTLVLDNVDLTCTVAPAILVLNAYECGTKDTETATKDVDTTNAGMNLVLADNSKNTINGSYVAKIYEEGTTDKKHKYDGAIQSKVSMNINGQTQENGKLTVNAANEGIGSNLHLTINGGEITINSADDAINTNEDGVSVLTINGGIVICDSGNGAEGDGVDSNGFIVVNGGYLIASANAKSQDSGVDSDMGIYINGGTVLASGHMYDTVSNESAQNFMVLGFRETISENDIILLKDANGNSVTAFHAVNDYSILIYSAPELQEGEYTLYQVSEVTGDLYGSIYTNITDYKDEVQLQYTSNTMMGMGGGWRPGGMAKPDGMNPNQGSDGEPQMPTDVFIPEMLEDGTMPPIPGVGSGEAITMPPIPGVGSDGEITMPEMPTDGTMPNGGQRPDGGNMQWPGDGTQSLEPSTVFNFSKTSYQFSGITKVTSE